MKLIEKIARDVNKVIIRSEYHAQISVGKRQYHDIWVTKNDVIKVKMFGEAKSKIVDFDKLVSTFGGYVKESTTYARAELRKRATGFGIFVDASYCQGQGRVAILRRQQNGDVDLIIRNRQFFSSVQAEEWGVREAMRLWPGEDVYCDCQGVVRKVKDVNVHWIPRDMNMETDGLTRCR